MAQQPDKLDHIRIKTARMLELHALLQQELDSDSALAISAHDRAQLNRAIATLAATMKELEANFARGGKNPPNDPDLSDLDQLVDSLLKLHMPNKKGE